MRRLMSISIYLWMSLVLGGLGHTATVSPEPPFIDLGLVVSRSEVHPGQEFSYAVSVFVESAQPVRVITSVTIDPYIEVLEVQTVGPLECGSAYAGWMTCMHSATKEAPGWLTYHLRVHPSVPESRRIDVTVRASRAGELEAEPALDAFWMIRAPDDMRAYYLPLFPAGGNIFAPLPQACEEVPYDTTTPQ